MQSDHLQPFVKSLANVFRTMLGCELRAARSVNGHRHEVSGIIGITGDAVGAIVLNLSKEVALKAASTMLADEIAEITPETIDAVGELTNMIAGGAKAELSQYRCAIGLPNVVTGAGHSVRFPSDVQPVAMPFASDWGLLSLEVGFAPLVRREG